MESNYEHQSSERFVRLRWTGPLSCSAGGFTPKSECLDDDQQVQQTLQGPGLYMVCGHHLTHGIHALLYIGQAKILQNRLTETHYRDWFRRLPNHSLFISSLEEDALDTVEELLIYSHSPPYNSSSITKLRSQQSVRVWNTGHFWALHPEVSSRYPWFGIQPPPAITEN